MNQSKQPSQVPDQSQPDQVDPEELEVEESDQQLERQHDEWVASLTDDQMVQFARRIKASLKMQS